ncbi:MAG: transglutaminase domain-containing protein [Bacillota bacterium]|nr:hypothetical protein [Bacillota bacterium]MDW7728944.1 transglutaminase domain-containing protein [Bacillota bacterium]
MRKKLAWVKSLAVTLLVTALMSGAGFYFFSGTDIEQLNTGNVDAFSYDSANVSYSALVEKIFVPENNTVTTIENEKDAPVTEAPPAAINEPAEINTAAAVVSESAKIDTAVANAVEEKTEAPAAAPAVVEETVAAATSQPVVTTAPVTYSWGNTGNYTFRMEVKVTNNGSETSRGVTVSVPLLENSSPYQTTSLKSTNYDIVSSSGRVSTFSLGDLAPGESKTVTADFNVSVRTVSIDSTNETVEDARKIYERYAGSGNCRELALGFITEARAQGINAREVIGFARPQRGAMTSGSLQGARHSWAEFYVDGLGWVPVDLTFQYFGGFPHTSHIVESYSDQSIKVNFTGGSLGATWINAIL